MRYAYAAWRILLATLARELHLPKQLVEELEDQASMAMFACTLDFEPMQVTAAPTRRVVGWRCQHINLTTAGGTFGPVSTYCGSGCDMQPVFAE